MSNGIKFEFFLAAITAGIILALLTGYFLTRTDNKALQRDNRALQREVDLLEFTLEIEEAKNMDLAIDLIDCRESND